MRAFFALPIDRRAAGEVEQWRRQHVHCPGRTVPEVNFHITLCFLGQVTPTQLAACQGAADALRSGAFELTLDEVGHFAKPKVLWIGPTKIPHALIDLGRALNGIASRAGLPIDKRPFQPHLTLLRKCRSPELAGLVQPEIKLRCDEFSLYESRSTEHGVRYFPLSTWRLGRNASGSQQRESDHQSQ